MTSALHRVSNLYIPAARVIDFCSSSLCFSRVSGGGGADDDDKTLSHTLNAIECNPTNVCIPSSHKMGAGSIALVCLLLAAPAAAQFTWVGGNMGFTSSSNWQNGFVPTGSNIPCSTTFGSSNISIEASVPAQQFNMGEALYLPPDGTLYLSSDDTVLTFSELGSGGCAAPSQPAVWVGGIVPDARNDFACHLNWKDDNGNPAALPPCAKDVALIPQSALPVHINLASNVSMVALYQILLGNDISVSTTAQIKNLLPQVNLFNNRSVLYVGLGAQQAVCNPYNVNPNDPALPCICYSSCPTPAMVDTMLTNQRLNQLRVNNITLNTVYTRPFTGVMYAPSLYVTEAQMQQNMANASQVTQLLKAVNATVLPAIPANSMTFSSFTISADGSYVTIVGTITGKAGNLFPRRRSLRPTRRSPGI
eukprot:m.79652 g.79652  ORF g.79652 m.79652 type:complete len:421 (+) comp8010_c0_seq1:1353-2615(+)